MSNYLETIQWHSWREETFQKARDKNRSIFLYITQSYSKWSLQMEEESFSKESIIGILNERFIPIKIYSDEHPELSRYYQKVHKMMNRSRAGFPISVFMTENLEPFYVSSYIAPEAKKELLGFEALLRVVSNKYITDNETLVTKGREILNNINPKVTKIEATKLHLNILKTIKIHSQELLDKEYGGFGSSPKFPNTSMLELLLDSYEVTKDREFLDTLIFSLNSISNSELNDVNNGGFYTYCQEKNWKNPYPLKTLYDNALLSKVYLRAYQVTKKEEYKSIAFKSIDFVISKLSKSKLFYAKEYNGKEIDETIITSWNSMMVSTLFTASEIDEKYRNIAEESLEELLSKLYIDEILYHSTKIDDNPQIEAFLEDYAYIGDALITAYQSTLNQAYIVQATDFANILIERFYKYGKWNFSNGQFTVEEEIFDYNYPSSLSVGASLLMSISSLVDINYKKFVFKTLEINSYNLMREPLSSPALSSLLLRYLKFDVE